MKYVNLIILLLLPGFCTPSRASSALAASFACQPINGIPATVVQTKEGKRVPIIFWKSNTFTREALVNEGLTRPQRRNLMADEF